METHFQRYPLLHLNLKNAIASNYEGMIQKIKEAISFEYERHASLLKSKKFSAKEKPYLSKPSDKARQRFSISSAKLFFISLLSGESFINEK